MNIKENTPVKLSSPDNFVGYKLGFYMGKCKKDGGYKVHLTGEDVSVRDLCIREEHGDTIISIIKE